MRTDVTVVIPSIPPRGAYLTRAVHSAAVQTLQPHAYSIAVDNDREGAGPTRTRALMAAKTKWVAFLDDDDEWLPSHLAVLLYLAEAERADVVWPWFEVYAGTDPLAENRGKQWDPDNPHMFPITALVQTELAQMVGFTERHPSGDISGEDHPFFLKCSELGGKFAHTPQVTWRWYHNTGNTSGLPSRW